MNKHYLVFVLAIFTMASCKKSETQAPINSISNQDAAIQVGQALSQTSGLGLQIQLAAADVNNRLGNRIAFDLRNNKLALSAKDLKFAYEAPKGTLVCGTKIDTAGSFKIFASNFDYRYAYDVACANDKPETINYTFVLNVGLHTDDLFDSLRYNNQFNITNLQDSVRSWRFAGRLAVGIDYKTISKPDSNYNGAVDLRFAGIQYDPKANQIIAGSASLVLTGANNRGTYRFDGNVLYNLDKTITITISGIPFIYNTLTGTVTLKS